MWFCLRIVQKICLNKDGFMKLTMQIFYSRTSNRKRIPKKSLDEENPQPLTTPVVVKEKVNIFFIALQITKIDLALFMTAAHSLHSQYDVAAQH